MLENAQVVALEGKYAKVKVVHTDACKDCKACDPSKAFQLNVFNEINAKTGDFVTISIDNLPKMFATIMYISPIISMIIGYFIGIFLAQSEDVSVLLSFSFLVIHVLIAFIICRKKKYRAYIVKINSYIPQ